MKKKENIIICALAGAILILVVSGIVGKTLFYDKKVSADNDSQAIVGTWKLNKDKTYEDYEEYNYRDYLTFYEDGSCRATTWSDLYDEDSWYIRPWYDANADLFGEHENYLSAVNFGANYTLLEDSLIIDDYGYGNVYYDRINYEDLILGDWMLTDEGSGANYLDEIKYISFYSDGTCSVDGTKGNELGLWSTVDGKLKVIGTTGGMFWNYDGFLCSYELYPNYLLVYNDDGSLLYKYQKIS